MTTRTAHAKTATRWAQILDSGYQARNTAEQMQEALAALQSVPTGAQNSMLADEIARMGALAREYEEDIEDTMQQILEDGWTPEDIEAASR